MFQENGPTLYELADQALSSTDDGYEKIAPKFDRTPFRTPDVILQRVADFLAVGSPIAHAIDFCAGTGAGMQMLRPLTTERVVGIDRVPPMLEQAKKNLETASGDAVLLYWQGDVLDHPFEPEFDLVVCFGAFGHILESDEARLVAQVFRALKPGGRFVFVSGRNPGPLSVGGWLARGFNAVMRVRNALIQPPFIMYYLTFMLPRCRQLLEAEGFEVVAHEGLWSDRPYRGLVVVEATKPAGEGVRT